MTLKEMRTNKGLYASFMAKQLDISVRHFYRIENGEGYLTKERAKKISKLYGVKTSEIMECCGGELVE